MPLATIQQLDPIYVDVVQTTSELLRLKRSLASGNLKENANDRVKIILEDNTEYKAEGALKFKDVTVNPSMLSVVLRIEVPNPDAMLLPGMYIRSVIREGVQGNAIFIPQPSLQRDFRGNPYVWIVNAQGVVEQRSIETGREFGDRLLVSSGLSAGDRVVVEGIQNIRDITMQQKKAVDEKATPAVVDVLPYEAAPKKTEKGQKAAAGGKDAKAEQDGKVEKSESKTPATPTSK
jgi:membrane fusion protein (multidrug efflux system)